jgi:GH25 family lysozyme M1 (1,4-beta-N-acetylmuramidase)
MLDRLLASSTAIRLDRGIGVFALAALLGACTPAGFGGGIRKAPPSTSSSPTGTDTPPTETTPPTGTVSTPTTPTTPTTPDTTPPPPTSGAIVEGIDVSRWQGDVGWDDVSADGYAFAMVKATEGTYYESPNFSTQYGGSYDVGLVRGSYHFAIPDDSDGATQAEFFVDHGGGWSADGQTLPGVLDIEWNPYDADACYGLSDGEMADWLRDFSDRYEDLTGRMPMIYTAASWWSQCVNDGSFDNPLWVAHYLAGAPAGSPNLPVGWSGYDFWQYTSEGSVSGVSGDCDVNTFRGTWNDLVDFATNP